MSRKKSKGGRGDSDAGTRTGKKSKRSRKPAARDEQQVELLPDFVPEPKVEGEAAESSAGPTPDEVRARETPVTTVAEVPDRTQAPEVSGAGASGAVSPAAGTQPASPRPQGNQLARARDLVESGRIEDAIEQYGEILRENPRNLRAHNNLGVLFDELGQHDTAIEHFESALEVETENVEVLTNYGAALTKLARFDLADGLLRRALRISPDDPPARLAVGILSFRRGLYGLAETELRWVCEREPENGIAFYYRAEALNRISRFEEAIELMARASELLPDDPRPFYTLGHLYDRQSLPSEAAEMYRRARDLQQG